VSRTFPCLTILLLAALASGAFAQPLKGAGATFPYPLYAKWLDAYRRETGVAIDYLPVGSEAGIEQVKAGAVDFGATDVALSNERLKDLPRRVLHFPTVAGAVALVYNVPGVPQLRLTPELAADIWLGTVTSWNDPAIAAANPGVTLPIAPIVPVHRAEGSGTTNVFTLYLASVSGPWRDLVGTGPLVKWPSAASGRGNDGVAEQVRQTPGAIGYVELAYAKANGMTAARVRNHAGNYVAPTLESTAAAVASFAARLQKDPRAAIVNAVDPKAYPIAGLTYLLVYQDAKDAGRAKALRDFLRWVLRKGQSMAATLDYAALPADLVRIDEAALATLRANGKPIP